MLDVPKASDFVRPVKRNVCSTTFAVTKLRVYEDMYRAADLAMYFSKAQGGNQAIFYSKDLVSQARAVPATTREGRPEEGAKTLAEHNGIQEETQETEK